MVKSGTKAFTNADVTSSSGLSDATSEADVDLTRLARKRKAGKEPGGDENLEPNQEPVIDKQFPKNLGENCASVASVVKRTKLALSGMWSAAASGTVATLRVKNGQKSDADFAGLDNVGNTCFVNSCLYALRFLPGFPGAMHEFQKKIVQLGKKVELESQELKSCAELVLSLHEVFLELRKRETAGKKNPEAVRPLAFVDAFRNCQPSYQKGDQFDAHEFLLLILNSLSVLAKEVHKVERRLRGEAEEAALARRNNGGKDRAGDAGGRTRVRRSSRWNKGRCGSGGGLDVAVVNPWVLAKAELNNAFGFMSLGGWRGAGNKAVRENVVDGNERVKTEAVDACDYQETHMTGTCVVETKCLDCEETTNIVESFTLLSIPVDDEGLTLSEEASDDPSYTPILNRLRVEDLLADENKIFCDICSTRQPAKRSVAYSRLPAILVLHLKRFSTFYNARTSKIESEKSIDFLRTPSVIPCFCQECERGASGSTRIKCKNTNIVSPDVSYPKRKEHQAKISDSSINRRTELLLPGKHQLIFMPLTITGNDKSARLMDVTMF
ncbi:unnamed protein product [Notodromas monacha]|uniref:USP domain-containing protein n=1 Tax=Notodromas monacha TaxID=399045 RepID=A0A7R9BBJ2_9CRUS|nr:unnamed protein product [Notodromas monacha]CAG0912267.1 unnamed protein product [Notodromas monacha]